jgi:hypothetical protein
MPHTINATDLAVIKYDSKGRPRMMSSIRLQNIPIRQKRDERQNNFEATFAFLLTKSQILKKIKAIIIAKRMIVFMMIWPSKIMIFPLLSTNSK